MISANQARALHDVLDMGDSTMARALEIAIVERLENGQPLDGIALALMLVGERITEAEEAITNTINAWGVRP